MALTSTGRHRDRQTDMEAGCRSAGQAGHQVERLADRLVRLAGRQPGRGCKWTARKGRAAFRRIDSRAVRQTDRRDTWIDGPIDRE